MTVFLAIFVFCLMYEVALLVGRCVFGDVFVLLR